MRIKTYIALTLSVVILCLGAILLIPRAMMLQCSAMENNSDNGSWGYVEDGQM